MNQLVSLVPLFPLLGFLVLATGGSRLAKTLAAWIGSGAILLSFLVSLSLFFHQAGQDGKASETVHLFPWIEVGSLKLSMSFLIDPLSSLFLLIITGIGFLIHVYSAGYMHDDEGHNRFFSYLNLFVFFMLLLVLGSNYVVMFVGWEGVGLCSYLLIGFWFKNTSYNAAARKAFVMNRIGDLGFLLGMLLLFVHLGSLEYSQVFSSVKGTLSGDPIITAATMLLFIGAMGKSAQIPLYTWLPDAMAGPTPVSALIHAATMVTAGIYMVARSNAIFVLAPDTMHIIAFVGIATALLGAVIGLAQNDIKKVLAYSTVSQLGLMFVALGVGAFTAGVFHVLTHAFFKACLFLGAGSVIHAMSGEQDIRSMGGLKKALPITHATFLLATLAICGIFPFAGFFSKDEILAHAFSSNSKMLWILGLTGSVLTAFYMFRLYFLTFSGEFRGTDSQKHHLHESPASMTFPLIVLGVLSLIGGWIGLPKSWLEHPPLESFLEPVFRDAQTHLLPLDLDHSTENMLMALALLLAGISIYVAYSRYEREKQLPEPETASLKPMHKLVYNKFYIDEVYAAVITRPLQMVSEVFSKFFEKEVVDGSVNLSGRTFAWGGQLLRQVQTGKVGLYILFMVLAIALALFTLL
jgi:NADH-quinone oxidoreductase subunit L